MDRFWHQLDAAQVQADIAPECFVMVARDVNDASAVLRLLEHAADYVVVSRRPVPSFAQLPPIDDIADKVERLAIDRLEEIEQQLRIAAGSAQMRVGDPHSSDTDPGAVRLEVDGLLYPGWRDTLVQGFSARLSFGSWYRDHRFPPL